jgi:hypothetical protein
VLRPAHNLDAGPHGRDVGILEPNSESGRQHLPSPRHALWPYPTAPSIGCSIQRISQLLAGPLWLPLVRSITSKSLSLVAFGLAGVQTRELSASPK